MNTTITVADLIVVALFGAIFVIGGLAGKRAYDGRMSRFTVAGLCSVGAMQVCLNMIDTLRYVLAYLHG